MSGKKAPRAGTSYKNQYAGYRDRASENRKIRLERHVRKNPDDAQAKEALDGPLKHRRKKPINKGGFFGEWMIPETANNADPNLQYPEISLRDKHNLARAASHSLKIKRRRYHGDKSLSKPAAKSESAYAFEKEHENSVQASKAGSKRRSKKSKKPKESTHAG